MFNQSNISNHRKTNLTCYARTILSFRCKKLGNVLLKKIFLQKITNLSSESIGLFHRYDIGMWGIWLFRH